MRACCAILCTLENKKVNQHLKGPRSDSVFKVLHLPYYPTGAVEPTRGGARVFAGGGGGQNGKTFSAEHCAIAPALKKALSGGGGGGGTPTHFFFFRQKSFMTKLLP